MSDLVLEIIRAIVVSVIFGSYCWSEEKSIMNMGVEGRTMATIRSTGLRVILG